MGSWYFWSRFSLHGGVCLTAGVFLIMIKLTTFQLKQLDQHVYKREGASLLEPYLQNFWWSLLEYVPLWVAPSALTMLGLLSNILATIIVILYDPNIVGEAPSWVYLLCAVSLFVYQTMDALDGKQCYRTDTDDPLPEFFDHGADSLSNLLVTVSISSAIGVNKYPNLALLIIGTQLALFYCYHWQTYVSGIVIFKSIDVTEGQYIVMGLHMATCLYGVELWDTKIFQILELRQLIMVIILLIAWCSICDSLWTLLSRGLAHNGCTVAGTHMFSPAAPYLMVLASWVVYFYWSDINQTYLSLFLLVFPVPLVKLNINLVVACCTESGLTFDSSVIVPFIAVGNALLGFLIPEVILLLLLMVLLWTDLIWTSMYYSYDMACYLNRYIFIHPPEIVAKMKPFFVHNFDKDSFN